ncbi:WhiB family transcriptional regulator [Streptomyces sp. G3]|uniref:WhiB family transcriptional regulator n=1 Tax=Streptomyces sp. G3 TaxID=690144 RepID=UPI00254993E3|nr:WhiB family transcriptional regulator [Streptomyces sp. G3]
MSDWKTGARPAVQLGVPAFAVEERRPLPCRVDPDAFFVADERAGRAKALCAPCAYRGPCAEYAIGDPTLQGVWGGLTTRDRRALRRAGVADETPAAA